MPVISVVTPSHNPKWLSDCYSSLRRQTFLDWEWIVVLNGNAVSFSVGDPRVRVEVNPHKGLGIGALKRHAFSLATGKYMLELDHDDMLLPTALERVVEEFQKGFDFVYSHSVSWSPTSAPITYYDDARQKAWSNCGWRFAEATLPPGAPYELPAQHGGKFLYPVSFPPSAASLSRILFAPDHLRAWRRDFYESIGGHAADLAVADDHDLVLRTYIHGRMALIDEPLYLYRVDGDNTWLGNVSDIQRASEENHNRLLHRLVERECVLDGLPAIDLGGALGSPGAPWVPHDLKLGGADLNGRWPWEDSSVGAFRAFDFLEHLVDKQHAMDEVYRCLAPGGWLLSLTPSALGQGAFQDPSHRSYWVPNSFRYYTERGLAQYLEPRVAEYPRFVVGRLFTEPGEVPYVVADLMSLKGGAEGFPGERRNLAGFLRLGRKGSGSVFFLLA